MPSSTSNGRNHTGTDQQSLGARSANGAAHAHGAAEHANDATATPSTGLGALIAEAHALRDYLHDGYARAAKLFVALKRHRKQSKLVQSTLASLRQLQQIEG